MKIYSLILLSFAFFRTTGAKNDVSGSTVEAECAEGWTLLANTCGDADSKVCVKFGHPLKFVSWSHMQYECDIAGGYLPEPTETTKAQLKLILESYHQLYGETLMYLGATDVTHENEWKWFKSKTDIGDKNWGDDKPSKADNKDCLAQSSGTGKWRNVDCEENSHEDRLAFVCMRPAGSSASSRSGLMKTQADIEKEAFDSSLKEAQLDRAAMIQLDRAARVQRQEDRAARVQRQEDRAARVQRQEDREPRQRRV